MSKVVFEDVLMEMAANREFAARVQASPDQALDGYDLSPEERWQLANVEFEEVVASAEELRERIAASFLGTTAAATPAAESPSAWQAPAAEAPDDLAVEYFDPPSLELPPAPAGFAFVPPQLDVEEFELETAEPFEPETNVHSMPLAEFVPADYAPPPSAEVGYDEAAFPYDSESVATDQADYAAPESPTASYAEFAGAIAEETTAETNDVAEPAPQWGSPQSWEPPTEAWTEPSAADREQDSEQAVTPLTLAHDQWEGPVVETAAVIEEKWTRTIVEDAAIVDDESAQPAAEVAPVEDVWSQPVETAPVEDVWSQPAAEAVAPVEDSWSEPVAEVAQPADDGWSDSAAPSAAPVTEYAAAEGEVQLEAPSPQSEVWSATFTAAVAAATTELAAEDLIDSGFAFPALEEIPVIGDLPQPSQSMGENGEAVPAPMSW